MHLTMRPSNLIGFLLLSLPFAFSSDTSRQLSGASMKDYALLGYNFASFNTGDSFSCAHRCLSRDHCKSYNYAVQGPQQGLCELNSVGRDGPKPLEYRPGFVFVETLMRKPVQAKTSCVDHLRAGARTSGVYQLEEDGGNNKFAVYCDFHSESGWFWTLVMSQSHANRAKTEFRHTPFFQDAPFNGENPNWEAYRLSFYRMNLLKTHSTHWRATCSFLTHGVDYRDYFRAEFSKFDLLKPAAIRGLCKKVEYIDVRGHNCTECSSVWWQTPSGSAHHDSASDRCDFGSTPGAVSSEDNFGYYGNANPSFRCSSSDGANTNHWFGRRL